MQSYKDLMVWQKAITLSVACYKLTAQFPKDEMYGMTSQIRRASVSVAANIAEGHGRDQTRPFILSLRIAQGSLKELETHLILAEKIGLVPALAISEPTLLADEIGRMLRALIRSLQDKLGEPE
jgi:four helix bundle protein